MKKGNTTRNNNTTTTTKQSTSKPVSTPRTAAAEVKSTTTSNNGVSSSSISSNNDFYQQVDKVFLEFAVHRSNISTDASLAHIVPVSLLPIALGRLRLRLAVAELHDVVAKSHSQDGLNRNEFVNFVHHNLHRRASIEGTIHDFVELQPSGVMTHAELYRFLTGNTTGGKDDAVLAEDEELNTTSTSNPSLLNATEFELLLDQVDPNRTGKVFVGRLVQLVCPDSNKEEVNQLLNMYNVGESRLVDDDEPTQRHDISEKETDAFRHIEIAEALEAETIEQEHEMRCTEAEADLRAAELDLKQADEQQQRQQSEQQRQEQAQVEQQRQASPPREASTPAVSSPVTPVPAPQTAPTATSSSAPATSAGAPSATAVSQQPNAVNPPRQQPQAAAPAGPTKAKAKSGCC